MSSTNEQIRWQKKDQAFRSAKFLSFVIPYIKAIFLTGSVASGPINQADDLDFLIITQRDRVYLTRFFCYLWAFLLNKKRRESDEKDKWCMNIFLDEDYLLIPKTKRSSFSASQMLKAIVLFDRGNYADRFYQVNWPWVKKYFLNQEKKFKHVQEKSSSTSEKKSHFILEKFFYRWQIKYMQKKITNEYLSPKQIFFHPLKREERV